MKPLRPAFLAAVCLSAPAYGQSPGAAETSLDAAVAQSLTSTPVPGQSVVSISAGATLMTGRTETKGWSLDAIASHTTSGRLVLRVEAETARTDYKLPTGQSVEIENNHLVTGLVLRYARDSR